MLSDHTMIRTLADMQECRWWWRTGVRQTLRARTASSGAACALRCRCPAPGSDASQVLWHGVALLGYVPPASLPVHASPGPSLVHRWCIGNTAPFPGHSLQFTAGCCKLVCPRALSSCQPRPALKQGIDSLAVLAHARCCMKGFRVASSQLTRSSAYSLPVAQARACCTWSTSTPRS